MYNVVICIIDPVRNIVLGKFIVYRYDDMNLAEKSAKEFNEDSSARGPAVQRVCDNMQYLYPNTALLRQARVILGGRGVL